ncbi:hypothetical protein C9890_0408 [Perkinsus sp. BL_2016]|nr:hypothetical protein C9890_0408 [Perkinsus sp. BL_2016]
MLISRGSALGEPSEIRAVELIPDFPSIHHLVKSQAFEVANTILYLVNILLLIARAYTPPDNFNTPLFAGEAIVIVSQLGELALSKSFYTMFQIMTTESWNEVMRPIYLDHPNTVLLTTTFIAVTKYLILSLVTALILEASMATMREDEETLAAKHKADRERVMKELKFLFQTQLGSQTAVITKDEFEFLTDNPSVKSRLQQLGWFKTDLIDLWELLDSEGTCVLEIEPIVYNIHKLRGKARTKDILLGLKEASKALRVMDEFLECLNSTVNAFGRCQETLVEIQKGAGKITQNVEKIRMSIEAREQVQSRFHGISDVMQKKA